MCSHTKVTRDVGLATSVPPLKRALETLLFRVKAMLHANNCLGAFWIGNLKHRTILGDEVSSQIAPPEASASDSAPSETEEESHVAENDSDAEHSGIEL